MRQENYQGGKVRDVVGLKVAKTKIWQPNYINTYEVYFIVASANIEGGHGLPTDTNYCAYKLQN